MTPTIQNIMYTVDLGWRLDLPYIAVHGNNILNFYRNWASPPNPHSHLKTSLRDVFSLSHRFATLTLTLSFFEIRIYAMNKKTEIIFM